MELRGDPGTLSVHEQAAVSALPYVAGSVFKVFRTAKSGATVLVLDVIANEPAHDKLHVVKIQDCRQGAIERRGHESATSIATPGSLPTLVEHIDDPMTSLSVTVYEVAGSTILGIQPLSYYLEHNVAITQPILQRIWEFLEDLKPFSGQVRDRESMKLFDLCRRVVNYGKDRLIGANGLHNRFEAIVPESGTRFSLAFDGVREILPNPIAYAYHEELWRDSRVVVPMGPAHGDFHSDNLLWNEVENRLAVIDWATFSAKAPAFLDAALLEIDIVHRMLECIDARDWEEWSNISEFLSADTCPGSAPKGVLAVHIWNAILPIRRGIRKCLGDVASEMRDVFDVAYFTVLYSATLMLLRNSHVAADRRVGLYLLSARYLAKALSRQGIKWESRAPLRVPSAHEVLVGGRAAGSRIEAVAYLTEFIAEWNERDLVYRPLSGELVSRGRGPVMDLVYQVLDRHEEELRSASTRHPYEVTDVLAEIRHRSRVGLIGEPGGGKSFTLRQLAHTLASEAIRAEDAPIPVFVSLGGFTAGVSFIDFVVGAIPSKFPILRAMLRSPSDPAKFSLLLDGWNEIEQASAAKAKAEVLSLASANPKAIFVLTSRSFDLPAELGLNKITISALDPLRVKAFLTGYLGEIDGEELFWLLADRRLQGRDQYWKRFEAGGGTFEDFWLGTSPPSNIRNPWYWWDWEYWLKIRDDPRSELALARNPYMLSMIAAIFRDQGSLPSGRGVLFKVFVDALMEREKAGRREKWISSEDQFAALSRLAYSIQHDKLGTSVDRDYAVNVLGEPGMLDLAQSESILTRTSGKIAFTHQLLQEFFAAYALDRRRVKDGVPAAQIWPRTEWWKPVGFEDSSVILSGIYRQDPLPVLEWLRDANPELAARCIVEGGIEIDTGFRQVLIAAWLPRLTDAKEPPLARASIGRALGLIRGDSRPGVMYVDAQSRLPRFEWMRIPAGAFVRGRGSTKLDARVGEFFVSKYLVTNEQFRTFVTAGGYGDEWRTCWTDAGWAVKGDARGPTDYSETLILPNHPRIGINWYEALAFCRWLDKRFHERGEIPELCQIRLPTETEWERLARGSDGRVFPWGDEFDASLCNLTDFESTTAVGIFPNGASPYGVCDVVGNAWKWCLTRWNIDTGTPEDNSIDGDSPRCYRGGSWGSGHWRQAEWSPAEVECHVRYSIVPEDDKPDAVGFFVVMSDRKY